MINRWTILGVLFLARFAMAFQFQSAAALSPSIEGSYGVGLAEIGLLIGLYLAPGVIVALPGGAIATWLGDKRVVGYSMGLMLLGGAVAVFLPSWEAALAGRVLAGAGGVVVNIVMTKMLVDWFAGREISTALGVFVNSWPVGIAAALLALPWLAEEAGLDAARLAVIAVIATGLVLFLAVYRPPSGAQTAPALEWRAFPVIALTLAGLVWAFYNTALALVFSFGSVALADLGRDVTAASSLISGFMVVFSVFLPLGGILADRTGRRDAVILASFAGFAALAPIVPYAPDWAVPGVLLTAGAAFGLAAGPVMTLPSAVLPLEARAIGMGVFFTIYYAVMMAAPGLAGGIAERTGEIAIIFPMAAWISAACILVLGLFRLAERGVLKEWSV